MLVLSLVSGLVWTAAVARGSVASEPEDAFVGRIGDERAASSLGGLTVAPDLVDVARHHAQEMADQQRLHHNESLGSDVQGWQKVGENVGVGSSVEEIHQAFMASSSHRDNILDRDFTEVGVGVVVDGPDLWVVEVFRLPKAAPAAAPAPTQQPAPAESSPPTTEAPRARPRTGGGGGGQVRAASATATPPPAPSTTVAAPDPAPAPVVTAPPTTVAAPSPVTTFAFEERTRPTTVGAASVDAAPATVAPRRLGASASIPVPRDVTLPIGLAASLLLLVVAGVAWQVASERARSVSDVRTTSVVDVWELALAA